MIEAEILETVMLICFGLSWPLSVVKNIKARTAKTMSLPFILLILFGYIAGITSKFICGNVNYVLIAYFINVLSVLMNVVVYFMNRAHDRKTKQISLPEEKTQEGK